MVKPVEILITLGNCCNLNFILENKSKIEKSIETKIPDCHGLNTTTVNKIS